MPKPIVMPSQGAVWAITDAGLEQYNEIAAAMSARMADPQAYGAEVEDIGPSRLLSQYGSVAVLSIKGPMVNTDSVFNSMFGLTSYNDIKSALIEAATDDSVESIMLDINSPGGVVNGVADVGEMISTVDKVLKPVYAYTDGMMASAAYWLGASAREIQASQISTVGSIGVIVTHVEQSKAMEMQGITATKIRAGKYKQLANNIEPLTDDARAELQDHADGIYKIFIDHISEARGKSYNYTDQHMGQGRQFLAESAKEVGLVDGIASFDTALADFTAKKVDRSRISFENNGIGANMPTNKKKTLISAVQAAMVAAGHAPTVGELAATAVAEAPEVTEPVVKAEVPATETEVETGAPAPEVTDEGEGLADPAAEASAVNDNSTVKLKDNEIAFLKVQATERDGLLMDARIEAREAQGQLEKLSASMEGFMSIASKSINAMQVALGQSASDLTAAAHEDVLAMHARLSADFTKNFQVGGVAAVQPNTEDPKRNVEPDSNSAARLRATRFNKK